jgi:SAM-dependent methyltransferase
MKTYSILRIEQHNKLRSVPFTGTVLDLGGSKKSGYHEQMQGQEKIVTGNINASYGCDIIFDVQETFPVDTNSMDGVVSLNLFEHVYKFENAFKESARVLKPGGIFVISTPFMVNIHGSPDDYHRYTKSFYVKILQENGFVVERVEELGFGLFSLIFQSVGGSLPTNTLRILMKNIFVSIDKAFLIFHSYQRLRERLPLGYFVVARKI